MHERLTDIRADNTIFLMSLLLRAYSKAHGLSCREFLDFDDKYHVIEYVYKCPDVFDALPEAEMVKEVDAYVARRT